MKKYTVLITGASEGIGFEVAKQFAQKGYPLVIVARNRNKLDAAAAQLHAFTDVTVISKDLSKPEAAKEIYEQLTAEGIAVDILVNNAGIGLEGAFHELSLEKQTQMIQLNLVTLTEMTHYFAQGMVQRKYGRIVNLSSIAGPIPTPNMAVYGATKAYIFNFSQALHNELKRKGDFAVTAVCPGPTKTAFNQKSEMKAFDKVLAKMGVSPESVATAIVNGVASKRTIVVPNFRFKLLLLLAKLSPASLTQNIMYKQMK